MVSSHHKRPSLFERDAHVVSSRKKKIREPSSARVATTQELTPMSPTRVKKCASLASGTMTPRPFCKPPEPAAE